MGYDVMITHRKELAEVLLRIADKRMRLMVEIESDEVFGISGSNIIAELSLLSIIRIHL